MEGRSILSRWSDSRRTDASDKQSERTPDPSPKVKDRAAMNPQNDAIISIIGPGMKVIGDCITDGTMRVEGSVEGSIKAGKAVVVGKDGTVEGNIDT
ncbi:MAG: polymer-forming cytoskeletal protein, partial [Gemmatimonadetes bacterium]|nr:polymer-forming cytoskeletal protein [Gemmatimonadota bacterium]